MKKVFFLLLLSLLGRLVCNAQQSFLDSSFGKNGFLDVHISGASDVSVWLIIPQSNNEFFGLGGITMSNPWAFHRTLFKFKEGGSLDPTYANNGLYDFSSLPMPQSGGAMLIQPDDKILLADGYYIVTRLLPNGGGLDTTFDKDGIDSIQSFMGVYDIEALAIQSDGKIVMTGDGFQNNIGTTRCNADGSIDSSFGVNGKVSTNVGFYYNEANSVEVLSDGKILVAGYGDNTPSSDLDFVLIRYLPNGMLDTTFNHTGILYANNNNPGYGLLRDMKIQPDGKILLTGGSSIVSDGFLIVRLNPDGTKDTTFNHTGEQKIAINGSGTAQKIALQPDGKIIVAGYYETTKENWGIIRLLSNGTLDTNFCDQGKITLSLGIRMQRIFDIKIQDNGKIIVCGNYEDGSWSNKKLTAVRFLANRTNAVSNILYESQIEVYPIPTAKYVNISNNSHYTIQQLSLYSLDGKLLLTQIYPHTHRLSTEGLANGIYYLKLSLDNHQQVTKKIIIQKN